MSLYCIVRYKYLCLELVSSFVLFITFPIKFPRMDIYVRYVEYTCSKTKGIYIATMKYHRWCFCPAIFKSCAFPLKSMNRR